MAAKKLYQASLENKQGCNFDNAEFTNFKTLKSWARGRGNCTLYVNDDVYRVVNNRIFSVA